MNSIDLQRSPRLLKYGVKKLIGASLNPGLVYSPPPQPRKLWILAPFHNGRHVQTPAG